MGWAEAEAGKYEGPDGGPYKCRDCGADILGARVAHPVWDGPFPCSGSGRCEYETVPYCPNCDDKPNFHGSPVKG